MERQPSASQRALDRAAIELTLRRAALADTAPWLHAEVARRMVERLAVFRLKPVSLIEWWGFAGAGGALLEAACPQAKRVIVEPTLALAQRSRVAARRAWWTPRRWHAAQVEVRLDSEPLAGGAQLVWANMMLHAAPDPPALFSRWLELLQPGGFAMFSCLGPGTLGELRSLYSRLGWPSPAAAFVDMHDLGDMLVQAGFADPVLDQETLTLHWASPQALLSELRSLGANAAPDRHAGLRTPRWRTRLLRELLQLAGPDGRLRLSFEVAYGHAFKAAPRLRTGEATLVSLEEMRAMARSPGMTRRRRGGADGA